MKSEGLTEGEDAAKLSNLMEEACTSVPAFWKDKKKNKGCCEAFTLKVKGDLEKNMRFPTFDVALKKKKINIFKIGSLWCFKYFFNDKEIFRDLMEYYNREKYKFEFGSVGERNKIMKYLEKKGFGPVLIEDISAYTVKIDRFKKYAVILKNSINYDEKGQDRIFVMKDLLVEEVVVKGAERVV